MFTDFLPFFGTDYGLCSLIKPQVRETERLGRKQTAFTFMGLDIGLGSLQVLLQRKV